MFPVPGSSIRCRPFLDGVIVAKDAVGDQRVAREDRILIQLDGSQADDGGLLAAGPFERGGALRLFAGGYRIGEDRAFDERFHRSKLPQRFPVHVEGAGKACGEQNHKQ